MKHEENIGISRRSFIRSAMAFGTAVFSSWLNACTLPSTTVSSTPSVSSTIQSTPIPLTPTKTILPSISPTAPKPTSTPSPIPDDALFDESTLSQVYISCDPFCAGYPDAPPYHPDAAYPEYPFSQNAVSQKNDVYRLVRQALKLFHPQDFGHPNWNPLQQIIKPGDRVLIKPNLVDATTWQQGQMTHPAILRPIVDYVYKACGPHGSILLGDAPWSVDIFTSLVQKTGIQALIEWLTKTGNLPITLVDLNSADPQHTPNVNLDSYSAFYGVERTWFDAHGKPMLVNGEPSANRYRISPYVLDADVVISVPKAKVHCSGGITVSMKNAIGIIPAWDGSYHDGYLKDCAHTSDVDQAAGDRGIYLENDTIWRTMADLNRIICYADANGIIHTSPQRRILNIVDAVIAAEASQYDPVPYPLNTIIVGIDPIAVDAITARCMGFDSRQLKSVQNCAQNHVLPLGYSLPSEIKIHTDNQGLSQSFQHALRPELYVYSWQGYLEAHDFDAPQIMSWSMPNKEKLEIHVQDHSAVSWVRASYEYAGRRLIKALKLIDGDEADGIWGTAFPHGPYVSNITITAGDVLFNEQSKIIVL